VITRDEAQRIRNELMAVLAEDAHNAQRLLARLDSISRESGIGAHAALILILTHLAFEEHEAREHWKSILAHREALSTRMGRDVGLRVALLDYFTNINRRLTEPAIIDLEMFEASERSSTLDPATGLVNDRGFRTSVQGELRRARRYNQHVSIVLFDLDDFAEVAETRGRIVAGRLLREAGILLKNKIRDIDLAARPGEDEFALVLPETDRNGALLVAERFRLEIEEFFARREIAGPPLHLTISGGVASYPGDANTPELLLERAAQALYRAKAAGKNVVHVYQPERRRFLRFELEPGRFEVEVLAPRRMEAALPANLSRNGILFTCPEALDVGEEIEIRLQDHDESDGASTLPLRVRGRVVRLEELPAPEPAPGAEDDAPGSEDRYEVGVAFEFGTSPAGDDILDFLERALAHSAHEPS
jgi:diguanylate cyclase (GGDEF)-like protein